MLGIQFAKIGGEIKIHTDVKFVANLVVSPKIPHLLHLVKNQPTY